MNRIIRLFKLLAITMIAVVMTAVCYADNVYCGQYLTPFCIGEIESGKVSLLNDAKTSTGSITLNGDDKGIGLYSEKEFTVSCLITDTKDDITSRVEVYSSSDGMWKEISSHKSHQNGKTVYTFEPCVTSAIRLMCLDEGAVSFSELDFVCSMEENAADYFKNEKISSGWIETYATPIATIKNPDVSGGSRDISSINDGYIPSEGDSFSKQYDTVNSQAKDNAHDEYIGYILSEESTITMIEFTEGGNFYDGGWFADGSMAVECYLDSKWVKIDYTITPEYPKSDNREDFLPDFETYTILLSQPVTTKGVRLNGKAGGSAHFISCGELRVGTAVLEDESLSYLYDLSYTPYTEPAETEELPIIEPEITQNNEKSAVPVVASGIVLAVLVVGGGVVVVVRKRKSR